MATIRILPDDIEVGSQVGQKIIETCKDRSSILFGCEDGQCGSCIVRVLEGSDKLSPKGESENDLLEAIGAGADERLACQCKVFGDVKIEVAQ